MSELIAYRPPEQEKNLFRPWRELTVVAMAGMELCWLAIWYVTFSRISQFPVGVFQVAGILGMQFLVSHYLARVLNTYQVQPRVRRLVFITGMVLSTWITLQGLLYTPDILPPWVMLKRILPRFAEPNVIPPEFWVMLVVLFMWSRGVSLARRAPGVDRTQGSFQAGILLFCTYAFFYTDPFFQQHLPLRTVLWAFFGFLFLGLIAMSAARIYESGRGRGGKQTRVSRAWLAGIALVALLIVSLGIIPAVLLPPQASEYIVRYLLVLLVVLITVIFILASPFILILLLVLPALQQMWARIANAIDLSGFGEALQPLDLPDAFERLSGSFAAAKPATLWGILILAAVAILAGLSWRMWAERSTDLEEGETLFKGSDLWKAVQAALRRRLQETQEGLRDRFRLRNAGQLMAAARVRWIYARLMGLCARMDHPRPAAVTPLEFLPDLEALFPGHETELDRITGAYVRVRYGEAPETREEVALLQADWERILKAGRRKIIAKTRRRKENGTRTSADGHE